MKRSIAVDKNSNCDRNYINLQNTLREQVAVQYVPRATAPRLPLHAGLGLGSVTASRTAAN